MFICVMMYGFGKSICCVTWMKQEKDLTELLPSVCVKISIFHLNPVAALRDSGVTSAPLGFPEEISTSHPFCLKGKSCCSCFRVTSLHIHANNTFTNACCHCWLSSQYTAWGNDKQPPKSWFSKGWPNIRSYLLSPSEQTILFQTLLPPFGINCYKVHEHQMLTFTFVKVCKSKFPLA